MFTQKCFIKKNSKDLRDKIYKLGGRNGTWLNDASDILSASKEFFKCWDSDLGAEEKLIEWGYIRCENEAVFLEIANMKDSTDKDQWFVTLADQAWYNLGMFAPKGSMFKSLVEDRYMGQNPELCNGFVPSRRATAEEIINHYNNKKHE